jgi:hypothetical protein
METRAEKACVQSWRTFSIVGPAMILFALIVAIFGNGAASGTS